MNIFYKKDWIGKIRGKEWFFQSNPMFLQKIGNPKKIPLRDWIGDFQSFPIQSLNVWFLSLEQRAIQAQKQ